VLWCAVEPQRTSSLSWALSKALVRPVGQILQQMRGTGWRGVPTCGSLLVGCVSVRQCAPALPRRRIGRLATVDDYTPDDEDLPAAIVGLEVPSLCPFAPPPSISLAVGIHSASVDECCVKIVLPGLQGADAVQLLGWDEDGWV
jgi:hypothetical protein